MTKFIAISLVSVALVQAKAQAAVTISQTRAVASVNAFAPLDRSQYFDEHVLENTSPALLSASGDWTGTNIGGSTDTWHWVGSAYTSMTATTTPSGAEFSGQGSFAFGLTTFSGYVSLSGQGLRYSPGAVSHQATVFSIDTWSQYQMNSIVRGATAVQLYSITLEQYVFNSQRSPTSTQLTLTSNGLLGPGTYSLTVNTGLSSDNNVGAMQTGYSGSISNFNLSISVPEPACLGTLIPVFAMRRHRRKT